MSRPRVGIVMGSASDLDIMDGAVSVLKQLGIDSEVKVYSAHRTPREATEYSFTAEERGLSVIIAGAGSAAHLPGVLAACTPLPVIGVPIKSSNSLDGWDSILSILQMPSGVPVATVALDGAKNAGILAAQMISVGNEEIRKNVKAFKEGLKQKSIDGNKKVAEKYGYQIHIYKNLI